MKTQALDSGQEKISVKPLQEQQLTELDRIADILTNGSVSVVIAAAQSVISASNSSVALLGIGATFTGTSVDVTAYSRVSVLVYSDKDSAANGLKIEFSPDGTNWVDASLYTFTSGGAAPNAGQVFSTGQRAKFMRVVYTNGAVAQGVFILQTLLQPQDGGPDIVDLITTPVDYDHAYLTKAIIWGKTTGGGGGYVAVKVNPSGALVVDGSGVTGPVSIADGADVAEGTRADVAWSSGSGTVIAILKAIATAALATDNDLPDIVNVDNHLAAYSLDDRMRRLAEQNLIQNMIGATNAMLSSESENSQRMGFELR